MGILPSASGRRMAASFYAWTAAAAALLSFLEPRGSALSQLRLDRGIDDIPLGIDRPRFFSAVGGGRGQPVHRAIPVEIERIIAPALPRLGLGASAAFFARFGRAGQRDKLFSCHTAETDRRLVRSVPGFPVFRLSYAAGGAIRRPAHAVA